MLGTVVALSLVVSTSAHETTALDEHHLAARLIRCAKEAGACLVLVTSPHPGVGKTHLLQLVERCGPRICTERLAVGPAKELLDKLERGDGDADIWFLEGPALLDPNGALSMDPALWRAIDGAIVVAMGHVTTREDLRACNERLSALGVRPIGVVWNERDHPSISRFWSDAKARLVGMFQSRRAAAGVTAEKAA